ncbi:MAG: LysM peptidoglycan-binding domain-containing protein [Mycobacterium leprae]
MQTMPAKTRTMLVGGALLLLIASMGGLFYWTNYGTKEQTPDVGAALVGNQEQGVAAPATGAKETPETANLAAPASKVVPATHTVAPGETLSSISALYYLSPVYAGDIEALNEMSDADKLLPGMELKLPRPEDLPTIGG